MAKSNQTVKYSDAELAEFKALIDKKIAKTEVQLSQLEEEIRETTENTSDDHGGDWVDDSSNNSNIEMLNNMAIRQRKHLVDLRNALLRIGNKTYGICVVTGKLIDKKRLMAVPTTTKSLAAKNSQKAAENDRKRFRLNSKPYIKQDSKKKG
ncbi:MAG: TraR/DksA family transcriptional regulator [Bacteroidota bacterium]